MKRSCRLQLKYSSNDGICSEQDRKLGERKRWLPLFSDLLFHIVNPFPNKPLFLSACSTSPLKTLLEKEKLLITSNSSFSHSVFYSFKKLSAIFIKFEIVICKLRQFGSLKFVVWKLKLVELWFPWKRNIAIKGPLSDKISAYDILTWCRCGHWVGDISEN